MKSLFLLAGLFLASSMASAQTLKVATISMERLFEAYHETDKLQQELNVQRAQIQKENNLRLADIREIEVKISEVRDKISDASLNAKMAQDLGKEAKELQQDGMHKERERAEFLQRRNAALTQEMKKEMQGLWIEIKRVISEYAKAQNYDYVFDTSGKTTNGSHFLLHARDAADVTDILIKVLNGAG